MSEDWLEPRNSESTPPNIERDINVRGMHDSWQRMMNANPNPIPPSVSDPSQRVRIIPPRTRNLSPMRQPDFDTGELEDLRERCALYQRQLQDKDATIRSYQRQILQKDATIHTLRVTNRVLQDDLDAAYDEPGLDAQGRLTDRPKNSADGYASFLRAQRRGSGTIPGVVRPPRAQKRSAY
jgi:hypothetical protein